MFSKRTRYEESPKINATIFSRISFHYLNGLFALGAKTPIEEKDLWNPTPNNLANTLIVNIDRAWSKECKKKEPSFGRALWHANKYDFPLLVIWQAFVALSKLLIPISLGLLIDWFADNEAVPWHFISPELDGYIYALIFSLSSLLNGFLMAPTMHDQMVIGHNYQVQACSLIYKKLLRLNQHGVSQVSIGKIVNIMSNDVIRYNFCLIVGLQGIMAPLVIGTSIYFIYLRIQDAAFVTLAGLFAISISSIVGGRSMGTIRGQMAKESDQRIKAMEELIGAMRVIKMYCWESFSLKKIINFRTSEINILKLRGKVFGLMQAILYFAPHLVTTMTFFAYLMLSTVGQFRASDVFTTFSFCGIMGFYLRMFQGLNWIWAETQSTSRRITEILVLDEDDDGLQNNSFESDDEKSISCKGVNCAYPKVENLALKDLTFSLKSHDLLAVIGRVGCGKSSIFNLLLNDLEIKTGVLKSNMSISLAPQEAWIFEGTLKDNILLGRPFDQDRYNEVLRVSCLDADIRLLANGDNTFVGDRGITLSGGQKARVGLSRAIYIDADLYLLDDPLAAVDPAVATKIFHNCINGFLSNKARILVTHQHQFLSDIEKIVLLDNGRQVICGTFDEILNVENEFVQKMKDMINDGGEKVETVEHEETKDIKIVGETVQENTAETKRSGDVSLNDILDFLKANGSNAYVYLWILVKIGIHGCIVWFEICMSNFANAGEESYQQCLSENDTIGCSQPLHKNEYITSAYITYAMVFSGTLLVGTFASIFFYVLVCRCTQNIHDIAVVGLIRTSMRFFDTNPSGRIMNRFSKDMGQVDEFLPMTMDDTITIFLAVIGSFVLSIWANWLSALLAVPMIFLLIWLRGYYLKTAREIKRLDGILRSPVYNHVSSTIMGRSSIKAFGLEKEVTDQFFYTQDQHSSAYLLFCATSRWLSFRLDMIVTVYVTALAVAFIPLAQSQKFVDLLGLTPSTIGLALSSCVNMLGMLQWGVRQSSEMETHMTSVERILEYAKLEPEQSVINKNKTDQDKIKFSRKAANQKLDAILEGISLQENAQPMQFTGEVQCKNFEFNYYDSGPTILNNVSLDIRPSEKIGIVGRTGAGKSSFISAIFRMRNGIGGVLKIHGIPIADIPLAKLRSSISIIPQDPTIFSDSVRNNLDPHRKFSDNAIWEVLRQVELVGMVKMLPGGLEYHLAERGQNLSVGQKQLVCLARALLKRNKILLIDEATANVDPRTDDLIQETLRREFVDCTVLAIAHRLNTIIDYDKVIVMDAGKVDEFDTPSNLLSRNSVFKSIVDQSRDAAFLYQAAHKKARVPSSTSVISTQVKF